MWEYLIPAISLIVVQVIISFKQQRIQDIKTLNMINTLKDDIRRLEEEQKKHNSIIERTYRLEADMKTAFKRIDDIRRD